MASSISGKVRERSSRARDSISKQATPLSFTSGSIPMTVPYFFAISLVIKRLPLVHSLGITPWSVCSLGHQGLTRKSTYYSPFFGLFVDSFLIRSFSRSLYSRHTSAMVLFAYLSPRSKSSDFRFLSRRSLLP